MAWHLACRWRHASILAAPGRARRSHLLCRIPSNGFLHGASRPRRAPLLAIPEWASARRRLPHHARAASPVSYLVPARARRSLAGRKLSHHRRSAARLSRHQRRLGSRSPKEPSPATGRARPQNDAGRLSVTIALSDQIACRVKSRQRSAPSRDSLFQDSAIARA